MMNFHLLFLFCEFWLVGAQYYAFFMISRFFLLPLDSRPVGLYIIDVLCCFVLFFRVVVVAVAGYRSRWAMASLSPFFFWRLEKLPELNF